LDVCHSTNLYQYLKWLYFCFVFLLEMSTLCIQP
jgi:hypothetical protein